jgi:DNA-directed RNA polymerase beta subunit
MEEARLTRAVLDALFKQGGGPECANILVRHQIESFNELLDKKLVQIIQGFNPIQVCHNYSAEHSDFKYKMYLNVLRPSLTKPMYQTHDGAQMLMTPHVARINNLTYACNLYVDIHIITEMINNDGVTERNENTVNGVCIGKIPVMIRSKACVLTQMPTLADGTGANGGGDASRGGEASHDSDEIVNAKQECRFDYGGYFIVNGNEKVIISQDRISENKTLVFAPNCNGDGLNAEIRSMPDLVFLPPKTTSLHMSGKPNHMGHLIRLNASFLRSEIPLFVMFRALGIESDREIYAHIVMDLGSKKNERIVAELAACAEDACDVHTQEEALMVIRGVLGTTGTPKEYLDQPSRTMDIIKNTIRNDFLSHVGPSFKKKAMYVGYMVRKLISIKLGYQDHDNRDSYLNKRIDTPGILYANLFRQCYGKLIKDVRNLVVRELNLWRATPNVPMQLISTNNIHRFFKQTVIESGLRYALSTGNWGVKSIGSFQNIRQGVAQVLNRMSYLSTLSHLRRISTPMEKNGKLVQPRKLENTQYGMVCPAETPEGAPVGLVKNLAMSTHVTNNTSSALVRDMLEEMGVRLYDDRVTDTIGFLRLMGSLGSVSIMINGDIVGFHEQPNDFYEHMKFLKVTGSIPPKTAVVWDIPKNLIHISTEAGRLCRPVYIVEPAQSGRAGGVEPAQSGRAGGVEPAQSGRAGGQSSDFEAVPLIRRIMKTSAGTAEEISFNNLVTAEEESEEIMEGGGCVEFMDVDEVDKAMIAMFPADLAKGIKGTSLPPKYTHCEIHPSLMLGVLASNIPFMNHNQSPRNCYQCLWVEETVLLVTGERRRIADVKNGDNVLSFHPTTGVITISYVIAHIIRPASKPMCRITTITGRTIVVTTDHKFMTADGWQDSTKFLCSSDTGGLRNATTIGIHYMTERNDHVADARTVCMARIQGYYHGRPSLGFDSILDEDRFNDDVKFIGFKDGYRSMEFLQWINSLPDMQGGGRYAYTCGVGSAITDSELAASEAAAYDCEFVYNHKRQAERALALEYDNHVSYMTKIDEEPLPRSEWDDLVSVRGDLLMVPVYSKVHHGLVAVADITVQSDNHSFIGGDGFAVSNSAMGKQAVGIYASNFNSRTDTMAHVLHYPQKPLVQTQLSKYVNSEQLPSGINAVVAIMTHTGFNQEDSVMVNQSAVDRGLFTTTYLKSYRDQCSKNHSTGEEEVFMKPIVDNCGIAKGKPKPFNYDKLAEDGFVPKNTYINSTDILVGKVMPHKVQGVIQYRDTSMQIKGNDDGYVDMNYTGLNGDGYKFCKVRLRKYRKPTIGDKLASKHAQKGTIGMVYREADMPFTKDGIRPDIIMNPHAVPSRMTIAQLMECIMCKTACGIGASGDATPFNNCSVEAIADILEKSGYERYGNEILYNGRTGQQIQTEIFIGPTYYQRLKHMVADKVHCTVAGTGVLCETGWKKIEDVTMEDKVATLVDGQFLEYVHPTVVLAFPDFSGKMYHISNQAIDLDVTMGHRMYISSCHTRKRVWSDYRLEKAEDIVGKKIRYKKNANWTAPDYQFILPRHVTPKITYEEKIVDMDAWLTFFGIWMAEGCAHNGQTIASIAVHKQRVKDALYPAITKLGYKYGVYNNTLVINDKQLHAYLAPLSVGAPRKKLPSWVWELSMEQCRKLIQGMLLGDGCFKAGTNITFYYTSSVDLADDFQRLCLHAGWACIKSKHLDAGSENIIRGKTVTTNFDVIRLSVIKSRMNPTVNHGHHKEQEAQKEYIYDYTGPVYCLQVPSEVFMVRQNGKAVWTGNSRSSNGPVVLLTRQPAEGRARYGGLRFGEMERDGIVAHGAAAFLKERMLDVSDNFRVFPCKKCGMIAVANPEKNVYHCGSCRTSADICQVRMPYSMSLLLKELETMSVALRMCF